MALMDWTAGLELGVPNMDREHRDLVTAMNRVHELDALQAGKIVVDAAILHLARLTKQHFADEERHMANIGYADAKRHGLIHQDMLKKIDAHYAAFQQGDGRVPRAFFDFLVHWLRAHILGIDRKYAQSPVPATK